MATPDRDTTAVLMPADEAGRLQAVERYRILDSPPETTFDRFADIAKQVFDAPIALVTIVGDQHQAFKACYGLDVPGTDRRISFCTHAIAADATLVVPDAAQDPRFADNPLVTGETGLRFYAGAPLRTPDGHVLGTLCVLDTRPRPVPPQGKLALLETLADATMDAIERRLDRIALADAHARERRRGDATRARSRLLERIARHEEPDAVLAAITSFVDPADPARVEILAVSDGRVTQRATGLRPPPPVDAEASDAPTPGLGAPLPDAIAPALGLGVAERGLAVAFSSVVSDDDAAGWPDDRRAWLRGRDAVHLAAAPIAGDDGEAVGVVVRFADATADPGGPDEAEEAAERLVDAASLAGIALHQADLVGRLRHRAFHDALTGLPNRAYLHERLSHEMERARRDQHDLGVLMLDLDDFKSVNDEHGHDAGDRLLHDVAGRLAWVVRSDETVARLGGDEFAVVVRGADAARVVAERILEAFDAPFHVADAPRVVRPSLGLARWPQDGEGIEAILAAADTAMYAAKRSAAHGLRVYGDLPEDAA